MELITIFPYEKVFFFRTSLQRVILNKHDSKLEFQTIIYSSICKHSLHRSFDRDSFFVQLCLTFGLKVQQFYLSNKKWAQKSVKIVLQKTLSLYGKSEKEEEENFAYASTNECFLLFVILANSWFIIKQVNKEHNRCDDDQNTRHEMIDQFLIENLHN